MKYSKSNHVDWLNEVGPPLEDLKSNGGRIPDGTDYGAWMRRNDPVAFNVSYYERQRNLEYYTRTGENPA